MDCTDFGDLKKEKHPNQIRREEKIANLLKALLNPPSVRGIFPSLICFQKIDTRFICAFTMIPDIEINYETDIIGNFLSRECKNQLFIIEKECLNNSENFEMDRGIPVAMYSYNSKDNAVVQTLVECTVVDTASLSSVDRSWVNTGYNAVQELLEKC